jgi:hypothetical protein|tara:strand:+ start:848 stop:1327 length:480 start_codon:yes stop_codon:yes gene_type:complete
MSKSEDKLNDIFDLPKQIKQEFNNEIVPELVSPKPVINETESEKLQNELEPITDKEDVDNDYENARKNFYSLINKGNTAIDGILNLAKESEHPRSYEVAGQLIKVVGDTTQELLKLQKNLKELKKVDDKAPRNVTNALFVGSTSELQKLINGKKEGKDE